MAKKKKKAKKKVAKKKVAKKKVSKKKTKKKSSKKKIASTRPVGKLTGVGVNETWCKAFEENEKISKAKRQDDAGISKFMKQNFPGKRSEVFNRVQMVRNRYNVGALTGGETPKVQSNRYDKQGNLLTSRGKLANENTAVTKTKSKAKKKVAKKKASKKKAKKKVKVKRSKR